MAATSPYSNNDYQAASAYRPYKLPVNDIYRGISAQNEFWDAGARVVQNAYNNALDLQLSLQPNIEIRDNFIKEAQKQITKLSSMNLSDPSVQRQGISIFKPLMQDEGIISDDAATRKISKINSDALSYRNKDNGKFYSSTNHQYALSGAKEFKNSTDRMAGKQYLENSKEYEPFYDPSTELTGILKNCKPDKASGENPQGYYIRSYTSESLSALKINSCLDAGLSDKAKRQLQINGAVTYRDNPEALRDKYIPHLQGTRKSMAEQKAAMEGVLANKDNLTKLKPEDLKRIGINDISEITPDLLRSFEENKRSLEDRMSNIDQTISKLNNGDYTPIQGENFEPVSSMVYSRDYMNNVGEGFSYDFSTNSVKADPVQMLFFKESQENSRQEDDQQHDLTMWQAKLDHDLEEKLLTKREKDKEDKKSKGIAAIYDLTPEELNQSRIMNDSDHPFSSLETTDKYEEVTNKRMDLYKKKAELNQWYVNQLKSYGYNPAYKPGSPESRQWLDNFERTAGPDPAKQNLINKFNSTMGNYLMLDDLYKNTQDAVDVKTRPLEEKIYKEVAAIAPVKVGNSLLSGQDIYNSLTGKGSSLKIVKGRVPNGSYGGGAYDSTMRDKYYINGKLVEGREMDNLEKTVHSVENKYTSHLNTIKTKRNELMARQSVIQREGYQLPGINLPTSPFKQKIAGAIGMSEYMKNINIGQTDANGHIIIDLNPPKSGVAETDYDFEGAMSKLLRYGAGKNIRVKADGTPDANGTSVVLTGISEMDLIDDNNMSHVMAPYVRSLEEKTNTRNSTSTGYLRATNGQKYRLDISSSYEGGHTYKIIAENKSNSPLEVLDDRETALRYFEDYLKRAKTQ